MKQTIKQGATIDTVTPEELAHVIASAFQNNIDTHYRREKGTAILDGNGAGQILFRVPRLYDWICQRVTAVATNAAQFAFYENQVADTDFLEGFTLPGGAPFRYSDSFSNTMLVPAGSQLIVQIAGGLPFVQASVNLQIQLVRVVP